jgi:hypothetical protein
MIFLSNAVNLHCGGHPLQARVDHHGQSTESDTQNCTGSVALIDYRARVSQFRRDLRSDHQRQFVEGGGDGHSGKRIDPELVVSSP